MTPIDDEESHIHLVERASARGDRRWRAYTTNEGDRDGFGHTADEALTDFIHLNAPDR